MWARYLFRLLQKVNKKFWLAGNSSIGEKELKNIIPTEYHLSQNYPNPFNPTTKISFDIPSDNIVSLKIYDILGREVKTLVNEFRVAGTYKEIFNGASLASGIYFYRLETSGFSMTKKCFW
ncbi:MAG: T9SS type A sorting domain-containing protein [bacterium]